MPIENPFPLRPLALLLGLSGVLCNALAAEPVLKEVTVSGASWRSDLEADSPTNPYKLPTSNRLGTETFTAEDIRNLQPKDVYDLLDKATGMTITYQGRKNPFFVKERGGGSFTYIIDGAILPTVTQRILQRIPLAAIEELQVVRDSTALTLAPLINIGSSGGGDGLNTGFIIIRTKQPKADEVSIAASVEKSNSQSRAYKESAYAGKRFGTPVGQDGLSGFVAGFTSQFDRPSLAERFDGQAGHARMATAGIGNERASLTVTGFDESGRFEMQRGINVATGALDNSKWYYDPASTTVQVMAGTLNWNALHTTLASIFKTGYAQKETDAIFTSATLPAATDYSEGTSGFSLRHNARFANTFINLGTQATHIWALGSSGPTPNTRWDSTVSGYAATVEQKLLDDRLSLDAGYRQDKKHVATTDTTTKMQNLTLPPAKAISIGGLWLINKLFSLNGRYFDGQQGSANGDFSLQPLPVAQGGTGRLDAETQRRKEIAVVGRFSPLINVAATWFDVKIDNQKAQSSVSYTYAGATYYYYSQTNTQRSGYELLLKGSFGPRSSYKASWTHMTRNDSSNASVTTTNANNLYDLALSQGWEAWTANLSLKRIDSYLGSQTPVTNLGGYTRVDSNLMRDFRWEKLRFSGTLYGRNLTNNALLTMQGPTGIYPDRGRTIGVELKVDL